MNAPENTTPPTQWEIPKMNEQKRLYRNLAWICPLQFFYIFFFLAKVKYIFWFDKVTTSLRTDLESVNCSVKHKIGETVVQIFICKIGETVVRVYVYVPVKAYKLKLVIISKVVLVKSWKSNLRITYPWATKVYS